MKCTANFLQRLQLIFFVLAACALSGFAPSLLGADLRLERELTLDGRYDDNFRLLSDESQAESLSGARLGLDLDLRRVQPRSSTSIGVTATERIFDDRSFNRTNSTLNFSQSYLSERSRFVLGLVAVRSSVREREQDQDNGGSGLIDQFQSSRSQNQRASLSWNRQLNELSNLGLSVSASHQDFDSNRFRGSERLFSSVDFLRSINSRLQLKLILSYSIFESDRSERVIRNPNRFVPGVGFFGSETEDGDCPLGDIERSFFVSGSNIDCFKAEIIDNEQDTVAARVGFVYQASEQLLVDFTVGQSEVSTDRETEFRDLGTAGDSIAPQIFSSSQSNLNYVLDIDYELPAGSVTLLATADESINSIGVLRENTRATLSFNHRFSGNWSMRLTGRYLNEQSIDGDDNRVFFENENTSAILRLNYRLSQFWSSFASYQYNLRDRGFDIESADRNIFTLGFSWNPGALQL